MPETVSIARLIDTLQEGRTEICLVVDEHGGTAGIVTLSDVMEQIVGRIDDEYRHDSEDVVKRDDGTLVVDGGMSIDQFEDLIGFRPPEADEVETLGGLLANMLDRIPEEGDHVMLSRETATGSTVVPLTVEQMDRFRVDKVEVRIEKHQKLED